MEDEFVSKLSPVECVTMLEDMSNSYGDELREWGCETNSSLLRNVIPLSPVECACLKKMIGDGFIEDYDDELVTTTPREQLEEIKSRHPGMVLEYLLSLWHNTYSCGDNGYQGLAESIHAPPDLFASRSIIRQLISRLCVDENGSALPRAPEGAPFAICHVSPGQVGCFATRAICRDETVLEEAHLMGGCLNDMMPDRRGRLLNAKQMSKMEVIDRILRAVGPASERAKPAQDRIMEIWVEAKVDGMADEERRLFWNLSDVNRNVSKVSEGATVQIDGLLSKSSLALNGKFATLGKRTCEERWEVTVHDGDRPKNISVASSNLKTSVGIVTTNTFRGDLSAGIEMCVLNDTSRFNHACEPNLRNNVLADGSFRHQCVVNADIDLGAELTVSYSKNRDLLKSQWGFDCRCRSCIERGF